MQKHKGWMVATAAALILGLAALAGVAGCGGAEESVTTTYARGSATTAAGVSTTAGPATTVVWAGEQDSDGVAAAPDSSSWGTDQAMASTLAALEGASDQRIIADAQLEIEVAQGRFQTVFAEAVLLADRYGGYVFSSGSYASGEEDSMKSGTVAIRIPSTSYAQALSDASKLGTLKSQSSTTQDVTEEFVDLDARIKNGEVHVAAMVSLLDKAQTIDEILYVESVVSKAQEDLEALKGRMRYLEEHTSYSTVTMSIYEVGVAVEVVEEEDEGWGVVDALKDGLHNLVKAFNFIVKGLGVLIPILIVVGIIAYIVYLIVRAIARRNRAREAARYQPHPEQDWRRPTPMGPVQPGPGAPVAPGMQPGVAVGPEVRPPAGRPETQGPGEQGKES